MMNTFDQTQNYGMGVAPTMNGYNYQGMQGQPAPKFNNTLSAEEIKRLQQKGAQFSLSITQDEYLRGICNHRTADGTADTLVYDPITQEATCTICGYKFKPVDSSLTPEEIKDDVDNIVDILQTIKLLYIDLPAEAAKEYFQIIPLIEKLPQLFEFAAKNFNKHEATAAWQYNGRNMGAINMFNNLQNMFAGMNNGMYQQQPMGNPAMMNMAPGYPQAAYAPTNGFGYAGASMAPGYQPQTAGFQYTPSNAQAPVAPTVDAPAAPVATDTATVTQTVSV